MAEKQGHECKALDMNVVPWPSEQEIMDFSPDLLLVTSMTFEYKATRIIINKMKGRVPIVLGGPHASIFKEKLLEDGIDIVAVGEGENTLLSLIKNFPDSLEQVPGIIFKKDGRIVNTGSPEWVKDLNTLPFPAWHYFNLDLYANVYYGRKCLPVISSRGCPFHCVYCFKGVFGDRIRIRSAENTFQEVLFFKKKYDIGAVQFQDDLFTVKKSRVEEFCQLLIDNRLDIFWRCLGRVDQVDFELLRLMQRAGCKAVAFGIESGNQEVLDKMGKKMKLTQAVQAIEACNKLGIVSKGYYIIGLPWETHQTAKDTIRFAKRHRTTQLQFTIPLAFPGTELWNIGKSKGLPVEDYVEFYSWDKSRPPYSFSDHLDVKEIEHYIRMARNIGAFGRLYNALRAKKLADYPDLVKKVFYIGLHLLFKRKQKIFRPNVQESEYNRD